MIAKIRGYCLGGGLELALACDLRYAGEDSTFGFPEVGLGIVPGAGGIQYVARLASPAVAKELVMTAERFDAARAADEGPITDVVATDDLDAEVRSVAERIASQAPLAVQAAKASAEYGMQTGVTEAVESDNRRATTLLDTEDAAEGRAAFAEDRDPEFLGQ